MTGPGLADSIRSTMGFPLPVSTQLSGWGSGVVAEIQANGIVSNVSGSVTGTCPSSGGALTAGAATNGRVSGVSGSSLADRVQALAGYGFVDSILTIYCTQIANHINTSARVTFTSGNITGICTNTGASGGSLTNGAGVNGVISGLSGPALAGLIVSAMSYGYTSTLLTNFCSALCDYIMANATVSYASGLVTGVCGSGGGSMTAGAGTGGTIS